MGPFVKLKGYVTWVLGSKCDKHHFSWIRIGNWRMELRKLR